LSNVVHLVKKVFPKLEHDLVSARLDFTIEKYAKKIMMQSLFVSIFFAFIGFFVLGIKIAIPVLIVAFCGGFWFFGNYPKSLIKKREKDINRNLLFAGRYLLIKLESGAPLFLSMIGVSKSYGEAGKAFNDIVQDINFGSSIENAVDRAIKYNPCKGLTRILWELSNSIKTGTDITKSMDAILEQISSEYIIEIEKYGKKLNSLILFYLVAAIIFPSLGLTMFVVISSFINIKVPGIIFYVIGAMLVGIQLFFIALFRGARPAVNL
tara:strand:+ start:6449 stop:7246 length:798 start_codon:yes stop_codon:yes gene_type:complete